jgi:hypothetical protein
MPSRLRPSTPPSYETNARRGGRDERVERPARDGARGERARARSRRPSARGEDAEEDAYVDLRRR